MKAFRFAMSVPCVLLAGIAAADSADSCSAYSVDVPVAEVVASSALVPNLLGLSKSLRSESSRLLTEACTELSRAEPPEGLCPDHCVAPDTPLVVLRSTPTTFLDDYQDEARCEQQLETTLRTPLLFDRQTFRSPEDLGVWVEGFVRGKGKQGHELYDRCDGKCSPQYLWIIARQPSADGLVVDTNVTCGHARSREVNEYELSYDLRWTCRDTTPER